MSLQEEKEQLEDLLKQADAVMDKAKELFFMARSISNGIANGAHALIPGIVNEIHANGGPTVKRKRRQQLDSGPLMPEPQMVLAPDGEPVKEFKRACANCGKPGHRRTSCLEPSKDANKPMGKRACSKCRKTGHRSTTCPKGR